MIPIRLDIKNVALFLLVFTFILFVSLNLYQGQQIHKLKTRISTVENSTDDLEERVTELESKIDALENDKTELEEKVTDLEDRIDNLENRRFIISQGY